MPIPTSLSTGKPKLSTPSYSDRRRNADVVERMKSQGVLSDPEACGLNGRDIPDILGWAHG